jgi:hypothetical protein
MTTKPTNKTQDPDPLPQIEKDVNDIEQIALEIENINRDVILPAPVSDQRDKLTRSEASQIVQKYAAQYSLTTTQAMHSIAFWCQQGGYVRKVPNRSIAINKPDTLESLDIFREIIKKIKPDGTVRQLARYYANTIAEIALKQGYIGHLHTSLRAIRPAIQGPDLMYCAEFYTGLETTPSIVNEALFERAKLRQQTLSKTKQKGPKQKRRKK